MKAQITKMAQLATSWRTTPYIQEACTITSGKFQNVLDHQKTMETVWRGRTIPTHMLLRISILDWLDQLLFVKRYFDLGWDFTVTVYVSLRTIFSRILCPYFSSLVFEKLIKKGERTLDVDYWNQEASNWVLSCTNLTVWVLFRVWCRGDTLWRLLDWAQI